MKLLSKHFVSSCKQESVRKQRSSKDESRFNSSQALPTPEETRADKLKEKAELLGILRLLCCHLCWHSPGPLKRKCH